MAKRPNLSLEQLKICLKSLDKTIELVQHFPPVPCYSELLKLRSQDSLKTGLVESGVADLVNSHSVGLRHQNLRIHRDLSNKKQKLKDPNNGSQNDSFTDLFAAANDEVNDNLEFGKPSYPDWLKGLPPEWTVVQITESWRGKEASNLLGGVPGLKSLPYLTFIRFPCGGRQGSTIVKELEKPAGEIAGGGLLSELNSILEGNSTVNKDYRGNLEQYWKVKQEHHNQLKVLVSSLENWWLNYCKCLLIGELQDAADEQLLTVHTNSVIKLIEKTGKIVISERQETWIRLLVSCHSFLKPDQLIQGFTKILKLAPRSTTVKDIFYHLQSVKEDLKPLSVAKRNPVILVLDKVIQRLPWEAVAILRSTPVSRIPSLHMLHWLAMKHGLVSKTITAPATDLKPPTKVIEVNPRLTFYVVNPESNLPGTQERMQPILEEIWGKNSGVVGVAPAELQIKESLTQRDLFFYSGHGSATQYLSIDQIVKLDCRAAALLMGCSSGKLKAQGRIIDPSGTASHYLMAGSPCQVGMLWEVTDLDCDRVTIHILNCFLGTKYAVFGLPSSAVTDGSDQPDLLQGAVQTSRHVTRNFVNGAAGVVYGLPLRTVFHSPVQPS